MSDLVPVGELEKSTGSYSISWNKIQSLTTEDLEVIQVGMANLRARKPDYEFDIRDDGPGKGLTIHWFPKKEHEFFEVQFNFVTYQECICGFRPQSQEEMDEHIVN